MVTFAEKKFEKLRESIEYSNRQLDFARQKRLSAIKEMVGFHYAQDGSERRNPVNEIALAAIIHARLLAPKAPRAMATTQIHELMPTAKNLELALNQISEEKRLENVFRNLVLEALFSMGIAQVGLHTTGNVLGHSYGDSFVDIVTIDDYFCDMSAKKFENVDYEGHDYWLDYEELMESGWLDGERDIKPDEYTILSQTGGKRAESIATSETPKTYKDKIWLRDVWLPKEKLLVTYGVTSKKVLKQIDWDGPDFGTYMKLGYSDVPGNLLPLCPVALWRDLHELGNKLFRKLGDGADSQKSVMGFGGDDDEDVNSFKNAHDGDGIKWTGQEPKKLEAGGINPTTLAFFLQCRDLFSYFANNLDSLGGLGAMTQTVGQEKIISEAAGAQLRDMADKTYSCFKEIFRALAYYEWTDPVRQRTLQKPIPGLDISIPVEWNRDSKKGKISQYLIDIDIYSLQDDSPQLKLQKLGVITKEYILPLLPAIQQAGGSFDIEEFFKILAKYSNFSELADIVKFVDQPMQSQLGGSQQVSSIPSNTSRTYERVGRPGMTRQGSTAALTQLLMGGNPGGSSN